MPKGSDTSTPTIDTGDKPEELPPDREETGDADPDPEIPIALCDATPNPVSPPFESATWIGNSSYDPGGGDIIDYNWELISIPEGSTALMPAGSSNRYPFTPDLTILDLLEMAGGIEDPYFRESMYLKKAQIVRL